MPLTLKIKIPASLKVVQTKPPTPPIPSAQASDDEDDEDEDDPSGAPSHDGDMSVDEHEQEEEDEDGDESMQPPQEAPKSPVVLKLKMKLSTQPTTAPQTPASPSKPKVKKPRARPKLFGRVTAASKGPEAPGAVHVKKVPKRKPLTELLPRLVSRIKKKDHYGIFLEPVDTNTFPLYATVIKFPMDLSTMEKKLEHGQYTSLEQFSADFRLMIQNCKTFNPAPSLYHSEASKLETFGTEAISQAAGQLAEPQSPASTAEPLPPTKMEVDEPVAGPSTWKVPPVHRRSESISIAPTPTTATAPSAPPPPNAISYAHAEWQKQQAAGQAFQQKSWVRGPYKKTVARDAPHLGPEGELPGCSGGVGEFLVGDVWGDIALALEIRGKRYRTKKEKLELEKRGVPTLWDGSLAYAELEDPYSVLHKFTPEPPGMPGLQSLVHNPQLDRYPISTAASRLADRTDEIIKQSERQLSAYFVSHGYTSTRPVALPDSEEAHVYPYWEREAVPTDFGVFPNLGEVRPFDLAKLEERLLDSQGAAKDSLGYLRDVVYGDMKGLAYSRSIAEFVHGARAVEVEVKNEEEGELVYEDPPGGLGMSLQDWVSANVLGNGPNDLHSVLSAATQHLRYDRPSPDNDSLYEDERLRARISSAVELRKEPIQISALVRDPAIDLVATDAEWDSEFVLDPNNPIPKFSAQWAERALGMAAKRIDDLSGDIKMEDQDGEEDEATRRLRLNLLALARFVPISEGIQLA